MNDWPMKTLGEVALVGAGNSAPQDKELFKGGMHRFVRTSDVGQVRIGRLGESADLLNDAGAEGLREFRAGVTLIPKSGASTFLNHRVQLTKPCFVSSHLAVVDSNPEVMDDTFMFYFLQTVRSQDLIQDQSYPSLNLPAISGINVLVPPLDEQKRIVELLDAATARVTELTACYEQARTHANNLFTSALRDALESNLDWPVKTLGEILVLSYGKPLDAKDRDDNGLVPVYGANGVKAYSRKSLVVGPSIIVGRKGSAGELNFCDGPFWPLDVTYYVEHDEKETDLSFLHYLLSLMDLPSLAKGVKPGINRNDVYALQATVPPLEEQKRIVARLDLMRAKTSEMVAAYDAKLTAAKNLRQSILEAAFAGDL